MAFLPTQAKTEVSIMDLQGDNCLRFFEASVSLWFCLVSSALMSLKTRPANGKSYNII